MVLDKQRRGVRQQRRLRHHPPAIDRLNQKMPTLKVTLDASPRRRPARSPGAVRHAGWPIPASTTIAGLSRWPRFARRPASPCRPAPTARRRSSISPAWTAPGPQHLTFFSGAAQAGGRFRRIRAPAFAWCRQRTSRADAPSGMTLLAVRFGQPRFRRRRRAVLSRRSPARSGRRRRAIDPARQARRRTWCWRPAW